MDEFLKGDMRLYIGKGQLSMPTATTSKYDWQIFIEAGTTW